MKRILCIWLPNWPVQQLLIAQPALRPYPVALTHRDSRRGEIIVACCRQSRQLSIRPGLPIAEAIALARAGNLKLLPYQPDNPRRALKQLAQQCGVYSPVVGLEPHDGNSRRGNSRRKSAGESPSNPLASEPSSIYLDLTNLTARWGGERRLSRQIITSFDSQGYWPQLGIADTLGAAWAAAHYQVAPNAIATNSTASNHSPPVFPPPVFPRALETVSINRKRLQVIAVERTREALALFPVSALRLEHNTLELLYKLGITQIGQLDQLPRDGLAARLGHALLMRLDQAYGDAEELITATVDPPVFSSEWQAEYPTHRRAVVQQVVEHLCSHLAELLGAAQQGAVQLICNIRYQPHANNSTTGVSSRESSEAECAPSATLALTVNLFRPTVRADHLWQLLQVQFEAVQVPGQVTQIGLTATSTAPLHAKQSTLWETSTTQDSRVLADFVDRLSNRLGEACVTHVRLQAASLPEKAYQAVPLTGSFVVPKRQRQRQRQRQRTAGQQSPASQQAKPNNPQPGATTELHSACFAAGQRPLHLLPSPQPIQVRCNTRGLPDHLMNLHQMHRIVHAWGPERIETHWWKGPCIRRDYYRVLSHAGTRLWIFHQLQPTPNAPHPWYLHGFF